MILADFFFDLSFYFLFKYKGDLRKMKVRTIDKL